MTDASTGEIVERLIKVANEELSIFDRISRSTALKLLGQCKQQAATIAELRQVLVHAKLDLNHLATIRAPVAASHLHAPAL